MDNFIDFGAGFCRALMTSSVVLPTTRTNALEVFTAFFTSSANFSPPKNFHCLPICFLNMLTVTTIYMFPHQVPTCPVSCHFLPADIYFLQCDRGSTRAHVTVGPPRDRIGRANTYIDSQLYKGFCVWFSFALTTRGPCGPAATPLGEWRSTRPQSPSMGEERQSRRGWGYIA